MKAEHIPSYISENRTFIKCYIALENRIRIHDLFGFMLVNVLGTSGQKACEFWKRAH